MTARLERERQAEAVVDAASDGIYRLAKLNGYLRDDGVKVKDSVPTELWGLVDALARYRFDRSGR